MKFEFRVSGRPAVQGNHAVSRQGRIFEKRSKALEDWREAFAWQARLSIGGGRKGPFVGAMDCELTFFLPRAQSAPVRRTLPIVRPDADKLARAALDAMTGVIWVDDSQVTDLTIKKRYDVTGFVGCVVRIQAPEAVAA